jgi:hypothetical protein
MKKDLKNQNIQLFFLNPKIDYLIEKLLYQ